MRSTGNSSLAVCPSLLGMIPDYPFTPVEFKDIYSRVPRLTVDVIIQTQAGVLMTLRQHESWHNLWHLPGGTVYYREKVEASVKRIAQDELGISVKVLKLLGYTECFSEEKERGYGYSVGLAFVCQTAESVPTITPNGEAVNFFWSPPPNIVFEHREFLLKNGILKHSS